jgi:HSP90 family molecular chaperone
MKTPDPTLDAPHVSGVLRRFGEDLHEDPLVAYRSLVDRAHTACVRRASVASNYTAAILVGTQTIGGVAQVSICDNGEALEAFEVRRLYAAIRTGRAGAVGRALLASGVDGADSVIGPLGVALLASLLVADQITIQTRAHTAPADSGARYICNSRTYTAERYRLARPGTLIQLRIRRDRQQLGTVDVVRAALVQHARSLALPIRVGADPNPINS